MGDLGRASRWDVRHDAVESGDDRYAKRARNESGEPRATGLSRFHSSGSSGATHADNLPPSGLDDKFHWHKKEAQEHDSGISPEEKERYNAERRAEALREVEQLNARRIQRERERKAREENRAYAARNSDAAVMTEWVAKEDQFQLEQMKLRAKIRTRENRAKPIDMLVLNWMWANPDRQRIADDDEEAGLDADLRAPPDVIEKLLPSELEELHGDIQSFVKLERDADTVEYWRNALIVCDDKQRALRGDAEGTHVDASILAETDAMLSSKSADELLELQRQIRAKLRSGEPLDVEYWEGLLRRIVVWRSIAKLRDVHELVQKQRSAQLQQRQRAEAQQHQQEVSHEVNEEARPAKEEQETWSEDMEPPTEKEQNLSYDQRKLPIVTLASQWAALLAARRSVLRTAFIPRLAQAQTKQEDKNESAEDKLFRMEAEREMDATEETFNQDVQLPSHPIYQWADKYRPRKPRYFNRVHTGYEWNRYNQTHYDSENPPPKVVQGYKFNIFYPDLIDSSRPPTYKILREDSDDTVLLRFSAGPPYEDIAFRIVDRAWEFSHRRGFRCTFERGVLQLHCTSTCTNPVNFKRLKYRK